MIIIDETYQIRQIAAAGVVFLTLVTLQAKRNLVKRIRPKGSP
jgi:hypothetical protein